MKRVVKKIAGKGIDGSIRLSKRLLKNNPKLKEKIRARVLAGMTLPAQVNTDNYGQWVGQHNPDGVDIYRQTQEAKLLKYRPKISIIVPTYNTPKVFFYEMIDSVLAQTYDNWELVLVDDASTEEKTRKLIEEYAKKDDRIVYKFLEKNHHIAGATNEGIKLASGEFVSLFDHDDLLWPNALFEIVKALNKDKKLNFIYTDEDKIIGNKRFEHKDPFFKPDWNHELLRSVNYITHFTTIRKSLLDKLGYENGEFNGAQDWELFLRITRNINSSTIYHIPTILYSWRVHDKSTAQSSETKPYVFEAQEKALLADLRERDIAGEVYRDKSTNAWFIDYEVQGDPLVSIVIPTKNLYSMVKTCIDSIYKKSTYKNFEVILVDTGSDDQMVINWYEKAKVQYKNFRVVNFVEDKFSYAKSCNYGAKQARGKFLLMLNNDIEVLTPNWIEQMVGYAQQPEIGIVGVKLYYPDKKTIQHAGVGIGIGGIASNLFQMTRNSSVLTLNQLIMLNYTRNISAITAACIIVRTDVFNEFGGFKEKYRINYNDVDLCLKSLEAGYRNVYLPAVTLIHHESISRGLPNTKGHDGEEFKEAQANFKKEWQKYIKNDPSLNINFSKDTASFDIALK